MRRYRKVLLGMGMAVSMGALVPVGAAESLEQKAGSVVSTSTVAEVERRTEDIAAQKPQADPNKRVCKRSMVTGSRFAKMVCHTQAQWDDMAQGTRSQMREIDSMRVSANGEAGPGSTGP